MKQAMITLGGIAVATGILIGMVIYTVHVMRDYEMRILTGENASFTVISSQKWK